jgi:hypothetical protein
MMWFSSSVLFFLLFVPSEVLATTGSWMIHNHCDFDIHYMITLAANSPMNLLQPNQIVSIAFQNKKDGSGMSIKMAKNDTDLEHGTNQLQLESTLTVENGTVWWDISRVNDPDNEWVPHSYFAVSRNRPDCRRRTCLAGNYRCKDEYVLPTDDYATTACNLDAIIEYHLCAIPRGISSSFSQSLSSTLSLSPSPYARIDG